MYALQTDWTYLMPHKFNASRRLKFAKKRYRVTNWSSYNESLRQRGDATVWLSPEVEDGWRAERRKSRGGQLVYSDLAITVCLILGMVYKQPLRQTEGLVRGLVRLMGLDLSVPGFSTLSRRGAGLSLSEESEVQRDGPPRSSCLTPPILGLFSIPAIRTD